MTRIPSKQERPLAAGGTRCIPLALNLRLRGGKGNRLPGKRTRPTLRPQALTIYLDMVTSLEAVEV